jgi:flagellar hook-associated protein 2
LGLSLNDANEQTTTMTTTTSTTATTSNNMLLALGAGSGVDTKSLAQNLVEAERAPQKAALDAAITKSEAQISGYAGVSMALSSLKDAFATLQTKSGFSAVSVQSSAPAAFSASASSSAVAANHSIQVNALAQPQRGTLGPLDSTGLSGDLVFSVNGGTSVTIAAASTPALTVSAINSKTNLGVTAQLVNTSADTSNPVYQIVLTSTESGSSNSFTVSSSISGTSYTELNAAQDAELVVDGLTVNRSSNSISDVISGVTLNLTGTTSTAAALQLSRNTQTVKQNITNLVNAFNDVKTTLDIVSDPASTVQTLGGSLQNSTLVRQLRSQLVNMVGDPSSTPGTSITALRDLGIAIQRDGTLKIEDETKLDTALSSKFEQVIHMFSNDAITASTSSAVSSGLAGDAVKKLTELTSNTGIIATQSKNAADRVTSSKEDLSKLEDRMTSLLDRYTKQFAAMDSLMAQMNSLKTQLKATFDGMSANNN